jgi:hypothetical protein
MILPKPKTGLSISLGVLHTFGLLTWTFLSVVPAHAQLLANLSAFGSRLDAGDPGIVATNSLDGPKGIGVADFDADGKPDLAVSNTDGTVTVFYGLGAGAFKSPVHLQTEAQELRGIACADLNGDGSADIAVAAPYAEKLFVFFNTDGVFGTPVPIDTWAGARNVAAGDFDGDGLMDLAVAGTTNGVRQLRNLGQGKYLTVTNLTALAAMNNDFPKPVYALSSFRTNATAPDHLLVTHADSKWIWTLAADANGSLAIQGVITNEQVHALTVAAITRPAAEGSLDLVTASRDLGTIEVHRADGSAALFAQKASQRMYVPAGPRALSVADLDGDGWNDLAVVLRNFDRVITYHNSNGTLVVSSEMPVGKSPREIVTADFNGDNRPDAAVMNRDSRDVNVLIAYPGQSSFGALDQLYPVEGEVSGLLVFDFNRDGRGDVIQLHRASAEISVRIAQPGGSLGAPQFYPMGALPSAQTIVDVNNDGVSDVVTANLGNQGVETGSLSVRLGDGQGGLKPEEKFTLPPETSGSLFALVAGDFDKDGNIDLAAGFFDCRLALFRGHGNGRFTFVRSHLFVYEARVMVVGDFDKDGDLDIAGAGYAGDVLVVENKGDLLTTQQLTRHEYPSYDPGKFGTRDIVATDVNGDGDLDLVVGSGNGVMLFLGADGIEFVKAFYTLPGTEFPAASVAVGDFDANGSNDLAVSCRILSCVTLLTRAPNGGYVPALTVDVPSGGYLASGDLDGDGFADLVGSGDVLWTALSSRRAQLAPPPAPEPRRDIIQHPVLNEVLAVNDKFAVDQDDGRTSDWVELYNGGSRSYSLRNWKLQWVANPGSEPVATNTFPFPPAAFLGAEGRILVVFSETQRTLYHTGFSLPSRGGVLRLLDAEGKTVDELVLAPQQRNVSYARFRDGLPSFAANPYPSAGRPNVYNGIVEPVLQLNSLEPSPTLADRPITFRASGSDDVGIVGASLVWRRVDVSDSELHRIILFDDGMHDDGAAQDGELTGVLSPGLPPGAEIQFYIEVTDLSEQTIVLPDEPVFGGGGRPASLFSLAVGPSAVPIEISEVLAWNTEGLVDGTNGRPDWVEIRNCSAERVSLRGVTIASRFFGDDSRFVFEDTDALQPGEHRLILCDGRPELGAAHAPFALNRAGDQLILTGLGAFGSRAQIDAIVFGPQAANIAYARLGCGGPWLPLPPTPRSLNTGPELKVFIAGNPSLGYITFPTVGGLTYVVESTETLGSSRWSARPAVRGNGIEQTLVEPLSQRRFYRLRVEEALPR